MLLIWDSIDMTFWIIEILEDEEAISNSTLNDQDILLFIITIGDGKRWFKTYHYHKSF